MNQVQLLKEYIKTLQTQNKTKNNQTTTLYGQLSCLQNQNNRLHEQINQIRCDWNNRQQYIRELEDNLHFVRLDFHNCINDLQLKQGEIINMKYQLQKDGERIMDLQTIIKKLRSKQEETKGQLVYLREQNKNLKQNIQSNKYNENNQQKVNELIENYEKIQQIAKQKHKENEILQQENLNLEEQVNSLKQSLFETQNQLKKIRKIILKKEVEEKQKEIQKQKCRQSQKFRERQRQESYVQLCKQKQIQKQDREKQDLLRSINLIRQNNKLIERVTELQRQKNVLYTEALSNICKVSNSPFQNQCQSSNPLGILASCQNIPISESRKSLKNKIDALKHQNLILLENLKI